MSRRTCPQCGYLIDEPARLRCPKCFGHIRESSPGQAYLAVSLLGAVFITMAFVVARLFSYGLILLGSALIWAGLVMELLVVIISLYNLAFLRKRYDITLLAAYVVVATTFLLIWIASKSTSPAPWV